MKRLNILMILTILLTTSALVAVAAAETYCEDLQFDKMKYAAVIAAEDGTCIASTEIAAAWDAQKTDKNATTAPGMWAHVVEIEDTATTATTHESAGTAIHHYTFATLPETSRGTLRIHDDFFATFDTAAVSGSFTYFEVSEHSWTTAERISAAAAGDAAGVFDAQISSGIIPTASKAMSGIYDGYSCTMTAMTATRTAYTYDTAYHDVGLRLGGSQDMNIS